MPLYLPSDNFSILGNTLGTPESIHGSIYLSGGANISLGQTGQTIEIIGAAGGGTGVDGLNRISAGTQLAGTLATILFANSNNITFGMSNSSVITASYTAPVVSNALQSVGFSTNSGTNVSRFAADDHIHAGIGALGVSSDGVGTTGSKQGTFWLSGGNNLTLSQLSSNNGSHTILFSVPTPAAQTVESQSIGMSNIGNTSGTTGIASGGQVRFLFAGGNNVTLSQSINGASRTITISAFNSVPQTGISSIVGSDATYTSGSVQFSGSNMVTVKSSANQRIIIDAIQTNQTLGLYAVGNTTGESSSSTFDARTVSYIGQGIASVGYSAGSILISVPSGGGAGDGVNILAAGTQTANTTGTVLFQNSNGLTFGMSNSSVITASYTVPTLPVVSNGILDVNSATNSGTGITQFAAHDHAHRGVAGMDVNGIASTFYGTAQLSAGNLMSVATGGASTRGSFQIINLLSSSAIANPVSSASNAGTLSSRFALADHAHAGLNSISAVGNTAGNTSAGAGSIVLAGGPNITLSGATAAGGMTLSISGGAGGGGGIAASAAGASVSNGTVVWSNSNNVSFGMNGSTITASASVPTLGIFDNARDQALIGFGSSNGTFLLFPLHPAENMFPGNMTINTLMFDMSGTGNTSAYTYSLKLGIYTLNGVSLSLLNSVDGSFGLAGATNNTAFFKGLRFVTFHSSEWSAQPVLSQAQYWMGLVGLSSGANQSMSYAGYSARFLTGIRSGLWGNSVTSGNSTMGYEPFVGISTASRTDLPVSVQLSELNKNNAMAMFVPHIIFNNADPNI